MSKPIRKQTTRLSNNVIVYDLETGGADPFTTEPIEIGAIVVDINTMTPKENGVFGPTLIRPTDFSLLKDEALAKNGIKREDLQAAPEQRVVFDQFTRFCRMFQKSDSKWDAMISSGYNVKGFDNIIMALLCKKYGYTDKDGSQKLFHPMHTLDLMDICRMWFHATDDGPNGYSLESIRTYFGVPKDGAHRAMVDVEHSLLILKRLMEFQKKLNVIYVPKFKDSFNVS